MRKGLRNLDSRNSGDGSALKGGGQNVKERTGVDQFYMAQQTATPNQKIKKKVQGNPNQPNP